MRIRFWTALAALSLMTIITGCGSSAGSSNQGHNQKGSQWLTANAAQKTADIKLEANYQNANGGMNFDGFSRGQMTITIPQGWIVHVTFSNDSSLTVHSAMVVPYNDRTDFSFSASSLAFSGASTPNPDQGTANGQTQTFTFAANKPGQYAIVCAIPGHAAIGMWDTLIVSNSVTVASISTK